MQALLFAIVLIVFSASSISAQADATPASQSEAPTTERPVQIPSRPELLRRIAISEAALHAAKSSHTTNATIAKLYESLGSLYKDAALFKKSEDATRRAITLLGAAPPNERADAITQLGMLHIAMSKLGQAERDQLQALSLYQIAGDPVAIALAWNDLAGVYIKQRQFQKALNYARPAYSALGDRPDVGVSTRIAVRLTLGFALCGVHSCPLGIPVLRDALALSRTTFGDNSLLAGVNEYVLGYAIWQSGDLSSSAYWMEHGTELMNLHLGSVHPMYIGAMRQYARFLHETGRVELATSADSVVRRASIMVDARSFSGLNPLP